MISRESGVVFTLLLLTPAAFVAGQHDRSGIVVEDCVVRFGRELNIPAVETGLIAAVSVTQNDEVKQGQVLARQDDSEALLKRRTALWHKTASEEQAADRVDVAYAEALRAEAINQRDADKEMRDKGAGTLRAWNQSVLAVKRAEAEVLKAQKEQRLAKIQLNVRDAELESLNDGLQRLKIASPINGIVLEIQKNPGEWITAGDTVARVAQVETLRVDAFLTVDQLPIDQATGCDVTVQWQRAGRESRLAGVVESVDPQLLPGGRYRLHAVIHNKRQGRSWVLLPGTVATMKVFPPSALAGR